MAFEKGIKKVEGSGRKPGVPNKSTGTVKAKVLEIFNKLQEPDEDGNAKANSLEDFANKEPVEFYKIASKLIPTEVNGIIKTLKVNFDGEGQDFEDLENLDNE